ncbi:YuzL family protein [Pseudomonas sp. ISL-84]|nr:YuzL family protein [Pseudomonas sp. ISL-84]
MLGLFGRNDKGFFGHSIGEATVGGRQELIATEVKKMGKMKKDPSRAGVSAASVQGDAGPTVERQGPKKRNSQNNQYKR